MGRHRGRGTFTSGVARAFPGGQAAHPEDQNEEENEEKLRKNGRTYRKMRKDWGNVPGNVCILPTREWEAGYGPDFYPGPGGSHMMGVCCSYVGLISDPVGGGNSTFFQVGVCSPNFRLSVGIANWYLSLKEGACELKISRGLSLWAENFQIWGLRAKIWAKIEAIEAKISKFSHKGSCELTLLVEMGPLQTTGEAWKGGLQGHTSPYPLSRSVPPGLKTCVQFPTKIGLSLRNGSAFPKFQGAMRTLTKYISRKFTKMTLKNDGQGFQGSSGMHTSIQTKFEYSLHVKEWTKRWCSIHSEKSENHFKREILPKKRVIDITPKEWHFTSIRVKINDSSLPLKTCCPQSNCI